MTTEGSKPGVFAAVAAAMGEVKRVSKDNRNKEQNYDFASVDDFMAMVGPVCARHGLVTVTDETDVAFVEKQGKYGPTQWALVSYAITTFHASGDHLPTVRRRVEVIRSGAQAYGAAQSYVLKQYYRGLFLIATGDKDDPDYGTEKEVPAPVRSDTPSGQPSPVDTVVASLTGAATMDQLAAIWKDLPKSLQSLPEVIGAKDNRKAALALPATTTEIPW